MATNFNKGFTNVANSSELPSSDWIKKEWDCANQIFFDDFDTLHANRYQVKQSGGGTGAIVNGEKDGVLRKTVVIRKFFGDNDYQDSVTSSSICEIR